jgi:peptidoglycan hydrolase-like protein with peptidoglycan-binding domain
MAHLRFSNLIEQKLADPLKKDADPFNKGADPFKDPDPFKRGTDPFKDPDPFKRETDPFKRESDPFKKEDDPFSGSTDTRLTDDSIKSGSVVKIGMRGDIVGQVQDLLIKLGYVNVSKDNKVDKIFGTRTEKMVKDFQRNNGLKDDGVVGKDTWPKLKDPAAVKNTSSGTSSSSSAIGSAQADVPKDGETTAGTDAIIIKESLRKTLRKNLLKFN